jgi:hypothetical protein
MITNAFTGPGTRSDPPRLLSLVTLSLSSANIYGTEPQPEHILLPPNLQSSQLLLLNCSFSSSSPKPSSSLLLSPLLHPSSRGRCPTLDRGRKSDGSVIRRPSLAPVCPPQNRDDSDRKLSPRPNHASKQHLFAVFFVSLYV